MLKLYRLPIEEKVVECDSRNWRQSFVQVKNTDVVAVFDRKDGRLGCIVATKRNNYKVLMSQKECLKFLEIQLLEPTSGSGQS